MKPPRFWKAIAFKRKQSNHGVQNLADARTDVHFIC